MGFWRLRHALMAGIIAGLGFVPGVLAGSVSDSAGRDIVVPEVVESVFPAGPPASIFLYMIAPDLMSGWPRAPRERERALLAPAYVDLPSIGRLTGRGGTTNLETVVRLQPDLILDYGSVRATYVSLADRVQSQTGIPYALIDGRFDLIPDAIRTVGKLIGRSESAETKALEAERIMADLAAARDDMAAMTRPRVYYGRGADGLQTGIGGSINTELLKYAGAVNVAEGVTGARNLAMVSHEQILAWNPDVILTTDRNFYNLVWGHPVWSMLPAVANGRVYLSPTLPFGWFDRPPSANRLIGLRWLLAVLYPDRYGDELDAETKRFYQTFYHFNPTDEQLALIFAPGTRPGTGRSK